MKKTDNISKETREMLKNIGYNNKFPISSKDASEWIEKKFKGATLEPGYYLWRKDLSEEANKKYPDAYGHYYERRDYIIRLAIEEIIKNKNA